MPRSSTWIRRVAVSAALTLTALAAPGVAAPTQLAVQGRLATGAGGPVADGPYPMGVALYDAEAGGKALYTELFLGVPVQAGVFAATLGAAALTLDTGLFATGTPLWVGVTVGSEAELARVPLRRVPYAVSALHAAEAAGLQCSGCVDGAELADGAVTSAKIATGAVQSAHVQFAWAGAEQKGGSATHALAANSAKIADVAKAADNATSAEEAKVAQLAQKLQCTGCVTAAMLADTAMADLVASQHLAAVAVSGKYADLQGGPDLAPFAKLGAAQTFTQPQTFGQGVVLGADAQFGGHQALQFRFQNADKAPATCDATTVGLAYYDTVKSGLFVCNGKAFKLFAQAAALGAQANPAQSCKQILDEGDSTGDGTYWLKWNSNTYQVFCDMTTEGGGWTRFLRADKPETYVGLQGVPNSQEFVDNGTFVFTKSMLKASNREVLIKETVAPFRLHRYDFKQGTAPDGEAFVGALTGDVPANIAVWNFATGKWQLTGNGGCNTNNHSQWNCIPPTGVRFHYSTRDWQGDGGVSQNTGWTWYTGYNTGYGDYGQLVKNWNGQYDVTPHDLFVR